MHINNKNNIKWETRIICLLEKIRSISNKSREAEILNKISMKML